MSARTMLGADTRRKFMLSGKRCLCSACGEYFNSDSTFSMHRVGNYEDGGRNRSCLQPHDLVAKGWQKNAAGFWIEKQRTVPSAVLSRVSAGTATVEASSP